MAAEESFPELLFICIFWLLHAIFSLTEYLMAFCYLLSAKWRSVFARDLEALDLEPVRNSAVKRSIGSTTGCTITEKAPTRAFSWLKAVTTAFTFKTLLRHYAKRTLTPR